MGEPQGCSGAAAMAATLPPNGELPSRPNSYFMNIVLDSGFGFVLDRTAPLRRGSRRDHRVGRRRGGGPATGARWRPARAAASAAGSVRRARERRTVRPEETHPPATTSRARQVRSRDPARGPKQWGRRAGSALSDEGGAREPRDAGDSGSQFKSSGRAPASLPCSLTARPLRPDSPGGFRAPARQPCQNGMVASAIAAHSASAARR